MELSARGNGSLDRTLGIESAILLQWNDYDETSVKK